MVEIVGCSSREEVETGVDDTLTEEPLTPVGNALAVDGLCGVSEPSLDLDRSGACGASGESDGIVTSDTDEDEAPSPAACTSDAP